jgi:ribonuclease Z
VDLCKKQVFAALLLPGFLILALLSSKLQAATEIAAEAGSSKPQRAFYFPNTETLGEREMRVIALGTGTPHIRPSQASTGWLVELGNGDKFFFDVGPGSIRNFSSLQIPYDHANKVFLSHLHVDHIGDLDVLWASGWTAGRLKPLEIWGPSGAAPEFGTRHYVNGLLDAMRWDYSTRNGKLPASGSKVEVHEFDYRSKQLVYDQSGVKIWSFPATHIIDGAVSYRLEWHGLTFVFSGDTTPNKWFVENAANADLLVHEVYMTLDQLQARFGWGKNMAENIARTVHTSPMAAGKIFSTLKPRMAVAYHFYNDFDTAPEILKAIEDSYRGRLVLAHDMMVFNVTAERITVRQAAVPENTWPPLADKKKFSEAERGISTPMSEWLKAGRLPTETSE